MSFVEVKREDGDYWKPEESGESVEGFLRRSEAAALPDSWRVTLEDKKGEEIVLYANKQLHGLMKEGAPGLEPGDYLRITFVEWRSGKGGKYRVFKLEVDKPETPDVDEFEQAVL